MKKVVLHCIIFLLIFLTINYAWSFLIPKTLLILPENSAVKIKWLLISEERDKYKSSYKEASNIHFFLNHKDEPIIIYNSQILFNPKSGYLAKFKNPLKAVISFENGVSFFFDGKNMGFLEIENKDEFPPLLYVKPFIKIPFSNVEFFTGENTLYAMTRNPKTKKQEIYLFDLNSKNFKKIASLNEFFQVISGKGEHLYLVKGRLIKELRQGKITNVYEHPREEITEIQYNEKVGLIYKTSNGVGLINNNSAIEFLQTENPKIYLKNTSLYVLFSYLSAIMEIKNLDDLKNYNFKVEKIIDIQQTFKEDE